jgi:NADH-quinone oxidoreductase subunit M
MFFAVASLGLPGLGNFIGEFLVLLGAFKVNILLTSVTALVLILSPVYSLGLIQKAFHGSLQQQSPVSDFNRRELASMGLLVLATVWLGLGPNTVLDVSAPALKQITQDFVAMEH